MIRMAIRILSAAAAFTLAAAPPPASAQSAPAQTNQVISANPFLTIGTYYNLEFERRHTASTTIGVSGSTFGFDEANYRNVQAFYRYYPAGDSLSGFYVGGKAGAHRVSVDEAAATFAGVGFDLGYTWLLGTKRHFAVSLGAGATRLFGGDLRGVSLTVPNLRANIGWSF